jgi:hypothetical protein
LRKGLGILREDILDCLRTVEDYKDGAGLIIRFPMLILEEKTIEASDFEIDNVILLVEEFLLDGLGEGDDIREELDILFISSNYILLLQLNYPLDLLHVVDRMQGYRSRPQSLLDPDSDVILVAFGETFQQERELLRLHLVLLE